MPFNTTYIFNNYSGSRSKFLTFCLLFTAFLGLSESGFAQNVSETGLFNIRNYSTKEYNMAPQNFAVVQDSRGVLYFGNNSDIIQYDGQNWDTIQTPNEVTVYSLTIDSQGVIYVGGLGQIGYLKADATGKIRYFSLLDSIKNKSERDFGPVWTCYALKDHCVYFQSSKRIFRWDGKKIKTWEPKPNSAYHLMYNTNNTLYVREKEVGLKKLVGDNFEFIQGGDFFAQSKVYFMQPFRKNDILLSMAGKGLFVMNPADYTTHVQDAKQLTKINPFHTEIDQFFINNYVYNGLKLNDKNYSIGTLNNGLVVIDTSGHLVGSVNKKTGLEDEALNYQYMDADKMLWLATNNGISRVDINSPITTFNDQNGLEGLVLSIARSNGKLYAATLTGVFYLEGLSESEGTIAEQPHFKRIEGMTQPCWDLLPINSATKPMLLLASDEGASVIEGDKITPIIKGNANVFYRSTIDSNRVFIGWTIGTVSTVGLTSIYWTNGKWVNEGSVGDVPDDITAIAEDKDGTLWCGHRGGGVIRIKPQYDANKKITNASFEKLIVIKGLKDESDESNICVRNIKGHIYFGTNRGLYKYDGNNVFSKDTSLGDQLSNNQMGIFRMDQGPDGSIWVVIINQKDGQKQVGYVKDPGKPDQHFITMPFMSISKTITMAMFHDNDGVTWLGGPDGLVRYDSKVQKNYERDYYTLIRKVIVSHGRGDSTIFYGAYSNDSGVVSLIQSDKFKPSLPYVDNSLVFTYAAPDFEDESSMLYSYRLEGSDAAHAQWSLWKNETKANYTYLPEGHYYFHVKAKNIFGHESREAIYEFTILSPWYRTIWAYIAYVLFFAFFIYGVVTVSTRSLRNIISERTAEVVKQKEVIELKNKDITDSINYAKRIQEAILPTRERFKLVLPQSFILFKPKDIVSGDFYWMTEKNDLVLVAAGDCTGHGVPGAMVSVVCSNALNRVVKEFGITDPGKILDKVRELVIETFEKSEKEDIKDGMDISLCAINLKTREAHWAGANNPLWYIQGNELKEITADKQPIGNSDNPKPFTTHKIDLAKGDEIYLFTDGYADQFGGEKGKKFKYKQLEQKVMEGRSLDMITQRDNLNRTFENWKGDLEQVDDVLIIGIRV